MVGAGASGINTARHMGMHMENFDLVIYEKNMDVGGTWFENKYVSCAYLPGRIVYRRRAR